MDDCFLLNIISSSCNIEENMFIIFSAIMNINASVTNVQKESFNTSNLSNESKNIGNCGQNLLKDKENFNDDCDYSQAGDKKQSTYMQ